MNPSRSQFVLGASAVAFAAPISASLSIAGQPFEGVDWSAALSAAGGLYRSACGAHLDRPHYTLGRGPGAWPGGYPLLEAAAVGFDRSSSRWVAAIPLHCGGTAAVNVFAVFADAGAHPKYIGKIAQGPKAAAFFEGGVLHVASALYAPGEPMSRWAQTRLTSYVLRGDKPELASDSVIATALFRRTYGDRLAACRLYAAA